MARPSTNQEAETWYAPRLIRRLEIGTLTNDSQAVPPLVGPNKTADHRASPQVLPTTACRDWPNKIYLTVSEYPVGIVKCNPSTSGADAAEN